MFGIPQRCEPLVRSIADELGGRGDDQHDPAPMVEAPATQSPVTATIELTLDDYAIVPAHTSVRADEVTISVVNRDVVPHDVLLIATDLPADRLPTESIRLDEGDPAITVVARTPRLPANSAGSITSAVAPGTYVLVCSVPHHYVREQMAATLTVQ